MKDPLVANRIDGDPVVVGHDCGRLCYAAGEDKGEGVTRIQDLGVDEPSEPFIAAQVGQF